MLVFLTEGFPSLHLPLRLLLERLLLCLSKKLKGISFFGRSVTMRVFVDDVAIFTDVDTDLTISEKVLDDFCKWTSSRLNQTKSKDLGLGGWRRWTTWLVN